MKMDNAMRISIPIPCHEKWEAMKPDENGRFCSGCAKSVIDFTRKSDGEINRYFVENEGTPICRRFRKSQIDNLTIEIPMQILSKRRSYRKAFLLALFISMGTTLFSCSDGNGNKRAIDSVEVVTRPTHTLGIPAMPTVSDTITPEKKSVTTAKHVKKHPKISQNEDVILMGEVREPAVDTTSNPPKK